MPLEKLHLTTTNRPIDVILHWHTEGWLLLDPPYQRGDVWNELRRVNLIKSILMGIPIPAIVINDRMKKWWSRNQWGYAVIDGKQRCQTITMFLDNKFTIPGEWVGLKNNVFFNDFTKSQQRSFRHSTIGFCEGSLKTLEQEKEVFELINFGGVHQGETDK